MTDALKGTSKCSFCGTYGLVFAKESAAICEMCMLAAYLAFRGSSAAMRFKFAVAWGGHEGVDGSEMTFTAAELSELADALVEVGVVAPIQALPHDRRLRRADDFLPDSTAVVSVDRVKASLGAPVDQAAIDLLHSRCGGRADEFQQFLVLASMHGGYTLSVV